MARRNGIDEQRLAALMVLLAAYFGQPATSLAMQAVQRTAHPLKRIPGSDRALYGPPGSLRSGCRTF